jgi:topoisomerase IV subunit B
VDGAHIATLLMTFFFQEMSGLVKNGHLYLAQPPLYRLAQGGKVAYARDDAHKDELLAGDFSGRGKVEIGRFKGLGEMSPMQLRETTMDPAKRTLIRVTLPDTYEERAPVVDLVDRLMGRNPEHRFNFIQERAAGVSEDAIDV